MMESWGKIFGIGSFTIIMVVGNGLFIPVIPAIQNDLQLSSAQASFILSSFSFAGALMIPISSWLATLFGRRNVLMTSLILLACGCILSSIAGFTVDRTLAYLSIISGRVLQGIGAGASAPISLLLASEHYEGSRQLRVISVIEMMNGAAKAISPICGSVILVYAWQVGFIGYLALSFIALATVVMLFPKTATKQTHTKVKIVASTWKMLIPIFLMGFIVMFATYGLLFVMASVIQDPIQRGIYVSLPLVTLVLVSYIYGRSIQPFIPKVKKWINIGLYMLLLAATIACLQQFSLYYLVAASTLMGAAAGLLLPASSSALMLLTSNNEQKKAITWLTMVRFFGVASGPFIFGLWLNNWDKHVYHFLGLTAITGLIIHIYIKSMDTSSG